MKKRTAYLIACILFFLCAGGWTVSLCMAVSNHSSMGMLFLYGFCLVSSLAAGILQLVQYRRTDDGDSA